MQSWAAAGAAGASAKHMHKPDQATSVASKTDSFAPPSTAFMIHPFPSQRLVRLELHRLWRLASGSFWLEWRWQDLDGVVERRHDSDAPAESGLQRCRRHLDLLAITPAIVRTGACAV